MSNIIINDQESKPRNFLVLISLCILFFCLLMKVSFNSSSIVKTTTTTIKETKEMAIIEPPKIEEIKPIINKIENIEIIDKNDEIDWTSVLLLLIALIIIGICFYLLYRLYKNKNSLSDATISDGDPIVVQLKDPVPSNKSYKNIQIIPKQTQTNNDTKTNSYKESNIRVMDTPVERKYGDLQIKYEPDPVTLQYPSETIQDIRNVPQQTYTPDQQYVYQPQVYQPQVQQYYVEDRPMPYDYVSQEEPQRRNVAMYDTYNAYEQKSCAIPPIDYDEIGCSNTRHGDHCQCETCV